jgi:hypothetical protein
VKWAGSRDKTFSPSGRGRTFFLTFLFIERFDPVAGVLSAMGFIAAIPLCCNLADEQGTLSLE